MTYDRKFGQAEGLRERLVMWADRLGKDKSFPWMGTGLIDDLRAAAGQPKKSEIVEFDL